MPRSIVVDGVSINYTFTANKLYEREIKCNVRRCRRKQSKQDEQSDPHLDLRKEGIKSCTHHVLNRFVNEIWRHRNNVIMNMMMMMMMIMMIMMIIISTQSLVHIY